MCVRAQAEGEGAPPRRWMLAAAADVRPSATHLAESGDVRPVVDPVVDTVHPLAGIAAATAPWRRAAASVRRPVVAVV
ncbi:hypothetical protein ACFWSF_20320 [Streptomyces sp. NPDC058611]|uniref:hypothetical protein n=1 Tax=unclassified Streptomyces TaxID=2593676 RepID=UPI00364D3E42